MSNGLVCKLLLRHTRAGRGRGTPSTTTLCSDTVSGGSTIMLPMLAGRCAFRLPSQLQGQPETTRPGGDRLRAPCRRCPLGGASAPSSRVGSTGREGGADERLQEAWRQRATRWCDVQRSILRLRARLADWWAYAAHYAARRRALAPALSAWQRHTARSISRNGDEFNCETSQFVLSNVRLHSCDFQL